MINVSCRSNLDYFSRFRWPTELPEVPRVGDLIRSPSSTDRKYIELEVYRVTWVFKQYGHCWHAEVELHLPKGRFENIAAWEKWVLQH